MAQLNDTTINGQLNINGTLGGGTIQRIFDVCYPVGSLWFSINNTNPKDLFNVGEWEKLPGGYALLTVTGTSNNNDDSNPANHTPKNAIKGGLPNITGEFNAFSENNSGTYANGAFYLGSYTHYGSKTEGDSDNPSVYIDASRCSAAYGRWQGDGHRVIPDHIGIIVWVRTR